MKIEIEIKTKEDIMFYLSHLIMSYCDPFYIDRDTELSRFFRTFNYGEWENRLYTLSSQGDNVTWNLNRIKNEKTLEELIDLYNILVERYKKNKNNV
jgi:hypothetical protein